MAHDKSFCFMEMSTLQRVHLKIRSLQKQKWNSLSVMTFQVQIYWMGQKTERLKNMQMEIHTRFTTLAHLTTDHEVHIIYNQWISSHFCWKCAMKIMDSAEKRMKSCAKQKHGEKSIFIMETVFSSRVCFIPSFKGKIFIWGTKKCPP